MPTSTQQQSNASPEPVAPTSRALSFFSLPPELRLEVYEFVVFSAADDLQPVPCSHRRMRPRQPSPVNVDMARLVSRRFGDEFPVVYYKRNIITLSLAMTDVAAIRCNRGVVSGGAFPLRTDYGLIRKLDLCIYLNKSHPALCQWCYWLLAKSGTVRPLFQNLPEGDGRENYAQPIVSLPSLRDLQVRFISAGEVGNYSAQESQIDQVIKTLAQALPCQAMMTTLFFTGQGARNPEAERLFILGCKTSEVQRILERPLWFQCNPPMKYEGHVQRWIDQDLPYNGVARMALRTQRERLHRKTDPRTLAFEERDRLFRRRQGRNFEVVALEVLGREILGDRGEPGLRLQKKFLKAREEGMATRGNAA